MAKGRWILRWAGPSYLLLFFLICAGSAIGGISPAQGQSVSKFGLPCGMSITATAMPGAIVALDIMDPCRPLAALDIMHAGLSFGARSDAMGLLTLDFPAFETPAFFTVRGPDGTEAMAMAGLSDFRDFARVAIAWEGNLGLALHALEGGAGFGAPGHIWQTAPGDSADMAKGDGGALSVLGDPKLTPSWQAQIYTTSRERLNDIRFEVDIPITADTCARAVRATAIHLTPDGAMVSQPILVTMPPCDGIGDFLVLQNPFDTTTVASD